MSQERYSFKINIIGAENSGKSNLLLRYVDDKCTESHITAIGVDFRSKTETVGNEQAKLKIWDVCGQWKIRVVNTHHYKETNAFVILLDLTVPIEDQKEKIQEELKEASKQSPKAKFILVGSKADEVYKRKVSDEKAKDWAKKQSENLGINIKYQGIVSAKRNDGVDALFRNVVAECVDDAGKEAAISASPQPPTKKSFF